MNITSKSIPAPGRYLPLSAFLLMTVALLSLAPQSLRANGDKPFHANFITQFTSVLDFPLFISRLTAKGRRPT
jgi:hypothetical protein